MSESYFLHAVLWGDSEAKTAAQGHHYPSNNNGVQAIAWRLVAPTLPLRPVGIVLQPDSVSHLNQKLLGRLLHERGK